MSRQEDTTSLKKKIRELKKEIDVLQNTQTKTPLSGDTVKVPEQIKPLFDQAQKTVGEYFSHLKLDPTHGTIEIHDERYVLVRATALSHDFLNTIMQLYADRGEKEAMSIGKNFLFDIARVIGVNDAKRFHQEMHLTDPIAKLAAGPVHFAYSGWAFVDILPESKPSPDENYYLIYHHPYSFEADSWIRSRKKSKTPVCIMNAGYSSGWCEESFGIPLTAVEVTCKAKGDKNCTFIMAPPHKIAEHVQKYTQQLKGVSEKKFTYEIPTFFERRKIEEQLALFAVIVESTDEALFSINPDHIINTWNQGAEKLFGYSREAALGKDIAMLIPPDREEESEWIFSKIKKGESVHQFETTALKKGNIILDIALTVSPVKDSKGTGIGASIIARDISRQKKAEAALKDLNNSLELLVQERTSELQRAYDDLETKVTFRNLELERKNKANLDKISALEKQIASLTATQ
jgi:PAS domain S-box-containing protein